MQYKVNAGSAALSALSGVSGGFVALFLLIPRPLKWIAMVFYGVWIGFLCYQGIVILMSYRYVTFTEGELVFTRHTVRPEDIKFIRLSDTRKHPYAMLSFNRRKFSLFLTFKGEEHLQAYAELRSWVWRNGIKTIK